MEIFLQDLRYAIRALTTSRRFTTVSVTTLAMGIAASLAIFTFVDAALVRPLPYRDPGRLVHIFDVRQQQVSSQFEASYPDYLDWKRQNAVFDSLAGYRRNQSVLSGLGAPELVSAASVSDTFLQTLGVKPVRGRDFRPGEDLESAPRTVLISYGWWQRRFGGTNDVMGRTLVLDDAPSTIIGVLPANFHFGPVGNPDVWQALHASGPFAQRRNLHWINVIARLKPGISRATAASAMNTIADRLERQYPLSNRDLRTTVVPLTDVIVGQVRPILVVLLSAVGLLLLIACANVANLLLARSVARRKEIAIRSALGASRGRLIRQMLTEGILLSSASALLGLLFARWMVKAAVALLPADALNSMPYLIDVSLDATVLFLTFGVAVATGTFLALAPALQLSGTGAEDALKEAGRGSHTVSWRRFASGLVTAEVAIALMLMAVAGLLAKGVYRLLQVDPGFNPRNLITMQVALPNSRYPQPAEQLTFYRMLLGRIAVLPGVKSAGVTDILPVSNGGNTANSRVVGEQVIDEGKEANLRSVDQGYFATLQAELWEGRWFTDADSASAPKRVVVNKTYADLYLPKEGALTKQIVFTFSPTQKPRDIVGVVRDVKEGPLDTPAKPAVYVPFEQAPDQYFSLVARTEQRPEALADTIVGAIQQLDPEIVVYRVQTMDDRIQRSPAAFFHRYPAWLAGSFAIIALLLGTIGLYSVIAYSVSRRTQEIGIRMALGAQRANVLRLVLSQGMNLALPGVAVGIIAGMGAAFALRSLLFGVTAWDPLVFSGVTIILAAVTLLASYIPARQATKVDPMVALRYE